MSAPKPASDDNTDSSLLARVRKQDADAWIQLVKWIGPLLLHWCQRAGLQAADGEDVSQQVLLKVWHGLASFRKENAGDSFRGWVYTITRNRIVDWVKKQRPAFSPLPVELPAVADAAEEPDLKQIALQMLIRDAVAQHVNDRGFTAFYRTAVDGLSAVEVGSELGMSADVVRQHKSRWIKRLRDRLGEQFKGLLD
jgi:RNA polymerase sigma-70 factor (ECF subfamily)